MIVLYLVCFEFGNVAVAVGAAVYKRGMKVA